MERALALSPEAVFAAGGDGTLRHVAERLAGTGIALAIIPGGTMNRVAERLSLPADPVAAVALYAPGRVGALDVATANGEVFLYQAIVGRTARLLRFREMQREGAGWWPLLVAGLRALFRPPPRRVAVLARGERRLRGHTAVVTTPETPGEGGLLVDVVRGGGVFARLRQAVRWARRGLSRDPDVAHLRPARLAVATRSTRGVRLSLDGEMRVAASPVRFRLRRGALRVLIPRAP